MEGEAAAGTCVFCERPVDPAHDYRQVIGYERHRSQGGTNALRLREPQDKWACRFCVDRKSKGIAPAQGTLI